MIQDQALREQLLFLLRGGGAHVDFESLIADFPIDSINKKPVGVPYTPWHVLEHMRIAQWDILEFSQDSGHVSPKFPEGYWPSADAAADVETWEKTVQDFRSDLRQLESIVDDPSIDIFARIPHGEGQTILREVLLVADHNAYHLGALALMKRNLAGT